MQDHSSTRRNVLSALPFIGAAFVAPAMASTLPAIVVNQVQDTDAEIQRHIEALKALTGEDIVVVIPGNPLPPRKTFNEMLKPATDEEREWWKEHYPSDATYLTNSGVIVQVKHEGKNEAKEADRTAACVWLVADGYEPRLMTADQLRWNIVGRVL